MNAESKPSKNHGSEKRVRNTHITIRLTEEERASIDGAAQRAGLQSGSYARQVLLGAPQPRQVRRPPIERKELARFLGLLGYVSNNMNQIARYANFGKGVDEVWFSETRADIRKLRDAVLSALGREP